MWNWLQKYLEQFLFLFLRIAAGCSEDSDYTSDLNYPVGGQGANSSASQWRHLVAQDPSRESSYEREEPGYDDLYYNSRPPLQK